MGYDELMGVVKAILNLLLVLLAASLMPVIIAVAVVLIVVGLVVVFFIILVVSILPRTEPDEDEVIGWCQGPRKVYIDSDGNPATPS